MKNLIVLTNYIEIVLYKNKSLDEINIFINFIVVIGCSILTITAKEQRLETIKQDKSNESSKSIYNELH